MKLSKGPRDLQRPRSQQGPGGTSPLHSVDLTKENETPTARKPYRGSVGDSREKIQQSQWQLQQAELADVKDSDQRRGPEQDKSTGPVSYEIPKCDKVCPSLLN